MKPSGSSSSKKRNSSPPLLPIALASAVRQVKQLSQRAGMDEEVITSAMLGMFFSSASWIFSILERQEELLNRLYWGLYRKYSDADPKQTERFSGADFALLFTDGPQHALLALFQAKRTDEWKDASGKTAPAIDLHYRPSRGQDKRAKDTQMLRLALFADRLVGRVGTVGHKLAHGKIVYAPSIDGVDWIHYIAYTTGKIDCLKLSSLCDKYPIEIGITNAKNMIHVPENAVDLAKLVDNILTPEHLGWLRLDVERAIKIMPHLIDMMPVVLGDSEGTLAPKLRKLPNSELIQANDIEVLDRMRADVEKLKKSTIQPNVA